MVVMGIRHDRLSGRGGDFSCCHALLNRLGQGQQRTEFLGPVTLSAEQRGELVVVYFFRPGQIL